MSTPSWLLWRKSTRRPFSAAAVWHIVSISASVVAPYSSGSRDPRRLRLGPFRTSTASIDLPMYEPVRYFNADHRPDGSPHAITATRPARESDGGGYRSSTSGSCPAVPLENRIASLTCRFRQE